MCLDRMLKCGSIFPSSVQIQNMGQCSRLIRGSSLEISSKILILEDVFIVVKGKAHTEIINIHHVAEL